LLGERFGEGRTWIPGLVCTGIAVVGAATSLGVRKTPAAAPTLPFRWASLAIPGETLALIRRDMPLALALGASSVFWMVGGIAIQAVNSLGRVQLDLNKTLTSIMTATIGLGIAAGALIAGRLSRGRVRPGLVRIGAWGIVACLIVISLLPLLLPAELLPAELLPADGSSGKPHLLGFYGSLPVLALLGVAAAMFAIPVQVFIQSRPPEGQKGRMIGVMNQANFTAALMAGVIYLGCDRLVVALDWPRSAIFAIMAALVLPVALFYRFRTEPAY
jgi:acyl-[acyl-carrier-protein]-phospholipid O-acyltransferase/long-chain-fatty-acid--[acyl-carrier-protein] ligase